MRERVTFTSIDPDTWTRRKVTARRTRPGLLGWALMLLAIAEHEYLHWSRWHTLAHFHPRQMAYGIGESFENVVPPGQVGSWRFIGDGDEEPPVISGGMLHIFDGNSDGSGFRANGSRVAVKIGNANTDSWEDWPIEPYEIEGQSIVSGTISAEGGIARGLNASSEDVYHVSGGKLNTWGGDVEVDGLPGGKYFYIYGGGSEIRGGHVTISGVHEMAVAVGGDLDLYGGQVTIADTGGEDAYRTQGGHARLAGGYASPVDGSPNVKFGGKVVAEGGSNEGGGRVTIGVPDIEDGENVVVEVAADKKLAFFGGSPIARPSISSADAASIIAAIAGLGLVVDDT